MKALECLEMVEDDLCHPELVKRSVGALFDLKDDKMKTEEYFNRYLFADARLRVSADDELREDEVDAHLAGAVRLEILNVIVRDETFRYAEEIIVTNRNSYRTTFIDYEEMNDQLPGEVSHEVDLEMKALDLMMDIFKDISIKEKMKELMDILKMQHVHLKKHKDALREKLQLKRLLAESKREIVELKEENERLVNELKGLRDELGDSGRAGVMTVMQLALFFVYLFDGLGVNFGNSDKTQWARLIHRVTGKSEQRIRSALTFDFESKNTRKSLRVVASCCSELFPNITDKINNELEIE